MKVYLRGDKPITVEMNYDQLPMVLKTIGITIVDPDDPHQTASFILRADTRKKVYTATLPPLVKEGTYPIFIYLINYDDESLPKVEYGFA